MFMNAFRLWQDRFAEGFDLELKENIEPVFKYQNVMKFYHIFLIE